MFYRRGVNIRDKKVDICKLVARYCAAYFRDYFRQIQNLFDSMFIC